MALKLNSFEMHPFFFLFFIQSTWRNGWMSVKLVWATGNHRCSICEEGNLTIGGPSDFEIGWTTQKNHVGWVWVAV